MRACDVFELTEEGNVGQRESLKNGDEHRDDGYERISVSVRFAINTGVFPQPPRTVGEFHAVEGFELALGAGGQEEVNRRQEREHVLRPQFGALFFGIAEGDLAARANAVNDPV